MAVTNRNNAYTLVSGSSGADEITNIDSQYVTIDAGAGNDTINNKGDAGASHAVIKAGTGNDSIRNTGHWAVIDAGAGDDTLIQPFGDYATITGGTGNDYISLYGGSWVNYKTFNYASGDGNDTIVGFKISDTIKITDGSYYNTQQSGSDTIIWIGSGSIKLQNYSSTVNIVGGTYREGGVTISNSTSNTVISGTSLNDYIINSASNVTINAEAGNDSISNNASYTRLNVGDGNNYVVNDGSLSAINAGTGNDYIVHIGTSVTINSGAGNDSICNLGANVTIDAGAGDDFILNAGADNDSTYNAGKNVTINAGDGNDSIDNRGKNVTIDAGAGNDFISLDSSASLNVIQYASGDGNDTISGLKSSDTIRIVDGANYSTVKNGDDVIISLNGGSMLLKNYSSPVNIVGGNYNEVGISVTNTQSYKFISGTDGDDYIVSSTDDESDPFYEVTLDAGDGNDTIYDMGVRSYIDAGAGNDSVYVYGSIHFDTRQATVLGGEGDDTIENINPYSSINGDGGADVITNDANGSTVDGGNDDDKIYNYASFASLNGGEGNDYILTSAIDYSGRTVTVNGGKGNDTLVSRFNVDIDIFDYYEGDGNIFQYASGDGYDTILGLGNYDTIKITDGSSYSTVKSGDDVIVSLSGGSMLLKNYSSTINIVGGKEVGVTLNNSTSYANVIGTSKSDSIYNTQARDVTIDVGDGNNSVYNYYGAAVSINGGNGNDTVYNSGGSSTIIGGAGNDTVTNYGARTKINVGAGDDVVVNHSSEVSMTGGAGNDTLNVHSQSNTINGGRGNDVINKSEGNNVIEYASGDGDDSISGFMSSDTIKITDGSSYSTVKSGDDVIISLDGGSMLLKNYFSTLNIDGGNYQEIVTTINNSTSNILISGTDGTDSIINSGSNVTINADAGNDMISLNGGSARIEYGSGDGDDTVYGYSSADTIFVTDNATFSTQRSGSDVIAYIGTGSLRLVNAYGKTINITDGTEPAINTIHNALDNVKVEGTDEDDYIINDGEHVTIQAGIGDDSITGSDAYGEIFMFSSADGNDTISNFGLNDSIRISNGSIQNSLAVDNNLVVTVKGAKYSGTLTLENIAADQISVNGSILTFLGTGEDIINHKSDVTIAGTDYDDYILNDGSRVTVEALGGNDIIENDGSSELFIFSADDGTDTITNFGADDSIKIKVGAIKSLERSGNDYLITVEDGNAQGSILLQNTADYEFVTSADNKLLTVQHINYIVNRTDNIKVTGTSNVDHITNYGAGVSIDPGAGDDTLVGSDNAELYLFSSASGNNVITNFGKNDTIRMTSGKTITPATVGNDVIVTLKGTAFTGVETLFGAASLDCKTVKQNGLWHLYVDDINRIVNTTNNVQVLGTEGKDWLENHGSGVTINPGTGDDTIEGSDAYGELFLLSSADGNNVITNFGANDSIYMTAGKSMTFATVGSDVVVTLKGNVATGVETLKSAAGLNFVNSGKYLIVNSGVTLNNSESKIKFVGTDKAEYMINSGSSVTIDGKGGGDTIEGSNFGDLFQMNSGYGNNVIVNFGENDTIQMTGGKNMTWSTIGKDVIVTLKGNAFTGTVTLKDGAYADDGTPNNFVKSGNGKFLYIDNGATTLEHYTDDDKFTGTSKAEWLINYGERVTIEAKEGNDTIECSKTTAS